MSSLTRSIRRGIMFKGLNKKQKRQKAEETKIWRSHKKVGKGNPNIIHRPPDNCANLPVW